MKGCGFVFHLAANADIRFGLEHPRIPLLRENHLAFFERALHGSTGLPHPLSGVGFRGRGQRPDLPVGQS